MSISSKWVGDLAPSLTDPSPSGGHLVNNPLSQSWLFQSPWAVKERQGSKNAGEPESTQTDFLLKRNPPTPVPPEEGESDPEKLEKKSALHF